MINKLFKSQYIIFYDQLLVSFSNFLIIILIQKLSGLFILGAFSFIWTFGLLIFSIQNSLILSPPLPPVAASGLFDAKELNT